MVRAGLPNRAFRRPAQNSTHVCLLDQDALLSLARFSLVGQRSPPLQGGELRCPFQEKGLAGAGGVLGRPAKGSLLRASSGCCPGDG